MQHPAGPAPHGVLRGGVARLGGAVALRAGARAARQRGVGARGAAAGAHLHQGSLDPVAVSINFSTVAGVCSLTIFNHLSFQ